MARATLELPGLDFRDLFDPEHLAALRRRFLERLRQSDLALAERWHAYEQGAEPGEGEVSALLIDTARHLSRFLAELFGVTEETAELARQAEREKTVFRFKNQ